MQVEDRQGMDELKRLAAGTQQAAMRIRLQGIVLAKQGRTAEEIAEVLGASRRAVQAWVHRYNHEGSEGLKRRRGQGRRMRLTSEQVQQLEQRIEAGPRPEDKVCTLRGEDLKRVLEKEFGVLYHLNGVYGLLHRLGYSCLMPRPQHRKADPQVQEAFKKKSASRWRRSARPIPRSGSKSGLRTKRGSVSKEH